MRRTNMNGISVEIQRKIMFIPVVNLGNFFIAVLNCRKTSNPTAMGFKVGGLALCILFPIAFFWGMLSALLPQLKDLFSLCCIYTAPVCMSYGLIKLQETYFF